MLLRRALLVALVAGCPGGGSSGPTCDFAAPAEAAVMYGNFQSLNDLPDGGTLPLIRAPQGGYILLVGARVREPDTCTVHINAALRDPGNQRVVGLEERDMEIAPRGDGWAVPTDPTSISSFANVAVCPNSAATMNVDGNPFALEVRLTGSGGGTLAQLSVTATPMCDAADPECTAECEALPQ